MTRNPYLSVNVVKLTDNAILPTYAHGDDAGADLYSNMLVTIPASGWAMVTTGIAIELHMGFVGLIHPRSGLATKHGITVLNAPGTIDAGYRGELKITLINHGDSDFVVEQGSRIAQLVIQRVEHAVFNEVTELDITTRGENGFGSTGMKG